jgi:hypothetical protein
LVYFPASTGDEAGLNAFFTSIWLWLYAGSGFVLKAAWRFDLGFNWFNRKFDMAARDASTWEIW